MIFIEILILIVAMALPSFVSSFISSIDGNKTNNDSNISSLLFHGISSIIFIYAGALILNALYIQSIGSGIGIYDNINFTHSLSMTPIFIHTNIKYKFNPSHFNNNIILGIKLIHSSPILHSNNNPINIRQYLYETDNNPTLRELSLIKYNNEPVKTELPEVTNSSFVEAFPWFLDDQGKIIDYNKSIRLFDGIRLINFYRGRGKKRFNPEATLSEVKISQLIEPFSKGEITVLELFNHVKHLYDTKKDFLKSLLLEDNKISKSENITSEPNSFSDTVSSSHKAHCAVETTQDPIPNTLLSNNKPLNDLGEMTLNNLVVNIRYLNWSLIINQTQITFHAIPTVTNIIGFGTLLRSYMKYVHNRPYPVELTNQMLLRQKANRNRQLAIFTIIGAPLMLTVLNYSALSMKDLIKIEFPLTNLVNLNTSDNNNPNIKNSINYLLIIISNINKKIPIWLKYAIIFWIFSILVIKLLGFNVLDVIFNKLYMKIYTSILCSLAITYQLLNLYLLHIFTTKEVKIPEILPDFIINWLKEFEGFQNKEEIKFFKKLYYTDILIYIAMFIVLILI